jgi:hypothetical protein
MKKEIGAGDTSYKKVSEAMWQANVISVLLPLILTISILFK